MFDRKMFLVGIVLSIGITFYWLVLPNHKSVVITSEHWVCTRVSPMGIEARCTEYGYVQGPKMLNE